MRGACTGLGSYPPGGNLPPQAQSRPDGNGVTAEPDRGTHIVLVESSKKLPLRREQVQDRALEHCEPLSGPVRVQLEFVMPRTKAMRDKPAPPMIQKPDVDKLARAVLDGLTGPAFEDDSQVTELIVAKRRAMPGEETGVAVTIEGGVRCEPTSKVAVGLPWGRRDARVNPAMTMAGAPMNQLNAAE
ncbi:RusA family crossover junction endodeoxyribonuclease [Corynebacterium sp. ACRPX]|uniref:RusA family crossover junction endodeoxyribonuclease n=1 Tax=Corynebacterium sp. ACRPX TaxID=2918185 RepID=UPI001EF6EC8B|nr:RusA family crossover junction endodeoxyribonuclease [Corynebacterium sp. ACRPX]MCG7245624.1 RusA family crossover junction endodeoxyribonuclease [Corynebacterium sp. ACRPX]